MPLLVNVEAREPITLGMEIVWSILNLKDILNWNINRVQDMLGRGFYLSHLRGARYPFLLNLGPYSSSTIT